MLMANSTAILIDAFPVDQRGIALGTSQIAGIAGMFIGLVAGGILAAVDWRRCSGLTCRSACSGRLGVPGHRDNGDQHRPPHRLWQRHLRRRPDPGADRGRLRHPALQQHTMGWTNRWVLAGLIAGFALLIAFGVMELRLEDPMFRLSLFKIRAFSAGNVANLLSAIARGGLQFMLIIWLQGIWLPQHGYNFERTPLVGRDLHAPRSRPASSSCRAHRRLSCPTGTAPGRSRPGGWWSSAAASSA